MPKVTFKQAAKGVRCERPGGERVEIGKGSTFELLDQTQSRVGFRTLTLEDPTETFLGGPDGKKKLPCTIRLQVPADSVTISDK